MKATYRANPIGSIASLAATLRLDQKALVDIARNADHLYSEFAVKKKDGSERTICAPGLDLKIIQKRINHSIFSNVTFPAHLYGGIEGRDYVGNAQAHSFAKSLIALDIRDFYPGISARRVRDIFRYFCNFHPDVADILTRLTTRQGCVPQGACTSSNLANLVFFDTENLVVNWCQEHRLTYTRLLDDITISSKQLLGKEKTTAAVKKIVDMIGRYGFSIKDQKTRIVTASNPQNLMEVTGLWLNRGKPRVMRQERRDVRSAIHRCQKNGQLSRTAPDYLQEHDKVSGRVSKLTYLGHFESQDYRRRLAASLPHLNAKQVHKVKRLVTVLSKTNPTDRIRFVYVDRHNKAMYRVGLLGRTEPVLARTLRTKLRQCRPPLTKKELIYG